MKKALILALLLAPAVASAQLENVEGIVEALGRIVGLLIPIVFALAILYFFWGLAQYILASGDPAAQESGRNKMIWGVVALFVMSAIWGLVTFLRDTLDIGDETETDVPTINVPSNPF